MELRTYLVRCLYAESFRDPPALDNVSGLSFFSGYLGM